MAVAGFAAFGNLSRPSSAQLQLEAAQASLGHKSGTFAGAAFAQPGNITPPSLQVISPPTSEPETPTTELDPSGTDQTKEDATLERAATLATGTGWLSEVQVRALVRHYFKAADVNQAVRVAWCESRFDPAASNVRTGGVGLFQHLPRYWPERAANAGFADAEPQNPEASVAAAAWEIYHGGGWEVFCRG